MTRQESLNKLLKEIKSCSECRLRATCKQVVPGEGNAAARLAFFAESPDENEDAQGRPLVGSSGLFWRSGLRKYNIREDEIFVANAVKCRPPENRDPNPDEKEACWKWTLQILQIVRPKVIVTLGRHALEGFSKAYGFPIGQKGIKKIAGSAIYVAERNFYVYPMLHPAHALKNPSGREMFDMHLAYLCKGLPGWLARPPTNVREVNGAAKKKKKRSRQS